MWRPAAAASRAAIVSAHNVAALLSGDTITCTFPTTSTGSAMSVNEFSGLLAAPLDGTASASGTNNSPNSGLTPATVQNNELVFGFVHSVSIHPRHGREQPGRDLREPAQLRSVPLRRPVRPRVAGVPDREHERAVPGQRHRRRHAAAGASDGRDLKGAT